MLRGSLNWDISRVTGVRGEVHFGKVWRRIPCDESRLPNLLRDSEFSIHPAYPTHQSMRCRILPIDSATKSSVLPIKLTAGSVGKRSWRRCNIGRWLRFRRVWAKMPRPREGNGRDSVTCQVIRSGRLGGSGCFVTLSPMWCCFPDQGRSAHHLVV